MGFRLERDEPLVEGIARVVREQIDRSIRSCRETPRDDAIHEVRKATKRLRCVVRLLRDALGRRRARTANRALRAIARAIAADRDRAVLLAVATEFASAPAADPAFVRLRARLDSAAPDRAAEPLDATIRALAEFRESWTPTFVESATDDVESSLRRGRKRFVRRAERAATRAFASGDDDAFHTFRKRVKDLGYATRLLALLDPDVERDSTDALDALAESLGNDHDRAMLRMRLGSDADLVPDANERKRMRAAIRDAQRDSRVAIERATESLGLGRRDRRLRSRITAPER